MSDSFSVSLLNLSELLILIPVIETISVPVLSLQSIWARVLSKETSQQASSLWKTKVSLSAPLYAPLTPTIRHRESYCSCKGCILTERHEKTKKNCNATLQCTWHFQQHLPESSSQTQKASKPHEIKSLQRAIVPFGENSRIIHGDRQRIMETRGRVHYYNGFSNPSGKEEHQTLLSLEGERASWSRSGSK